MTTRLDEVAVFQEKLRFLIPHEWIEGDAPEDHVLYHAPETDSGWLRVSLITAKTDKPPEQRLQELFGKNSEVNEETGNLVKKWEKATEEDGVPIYIFYWTVANAVLPNLVREAVFSYTVLADRRGDHDTREMVDLLDQVVGLATFVQQE